MTRKVLGRGLEALISTATATEAAEGRSTSLGGGATELAVDAIGPNPFQPRTRFDEAALKELADWRGNRADAGRIAPKGFPRSNKFGTLIGKKDEG